MMRYGSAHPERVQSMFLCSPVGTETYNRETYDEWTYMSQDDTQLGLITPQEMCEHYVKASLVLAFTWVGDGLRHAMNDPR